ncbi:cupin domain-containing protein [Adhaeribacter rhizoryzae]|uniref:Cupin domain-containing protein n=1 Tax=Adhaeribacter rhizoryzae TaxID=2607907 RepID=A0A5M6DMP3_9BACT|nr:cupin domain-containing protein [Adhaeribacter rhizoryzae]KAA5548818.1 cupin domain-containing protein [Adhaeribacter rhizoryzae]
MTAQDYIQHLNLLPHPEGGYYRETYRATENIPNAGLPARFGPTTGNRSFATAIYFLLPAGEFSAFHRIKSDEGWHFYAGGPLYIHVLDPSGQYTRLQLGPDLANGEIFQAVVPAGAWFASEPAPGTTFALVGCTVAPGFDFRDFEMAKAKDLGPLYPEQSELINRLCR